MRCRTDRWRWAFRRARQMTPTNPYGAARAIHGGAAVPAETATPPPSCLLKVGRALRATLSVPNDSIRVRCLASGRARRRLVTRNTRGRAPVYFIAHEQIPSPEFPLKFREFRRTRRPVRCFVQYAVRFSRFCRFCFFFSRRVFFAREISSYRGLFIN